MNRDTVETLKELYENLSKINSVLNTLKITGSQCCIDPYLWPVNESFYGSLYSHYPKSYKVPFPVYHLEEGLKHMREHIHTQIKELGGEI